MEQRTNSVSSTDTQLTQFLDNLGTDEATLQEVTPTVFNFSNQELSESEISILMKGMKFVPTPKDVDNLEMRADILTLLHKIKWNFQFSNSPNNCFYPDHNLISIKTHGKAPPRPRDPQQLALCNQLEKIRPNRKAKHRKNMSPEMYNGLKQLINRLDHLVIKEADKGSGVVLMPKRFYHSKISAMLSDETYETTQLDCADIVKRTKRFVQIHKSELSKKEMEAIIKQEAYMATFYGLPKIHKSTIVQEAVRSQNSKLIRCSEPTDLKFRPIVSCRNCPTRSLSDLLDKLLRPFVNKVKFRIKDTWNFLRNLPTDATQGDFTVTADIASLYTNIATSNGEIAISYYYEQYPHLLPSRFSKTFLIDTYKFCQENLFFCYENQVYRQVSGTGMGRIYAPSLADLKQGYDEILLEQKIRECLPPILASYFLHHYGRYLDDIHFRWNVRWLLELETIKDTMNSIDPNIKYEFESSLDNDNNSIAFLDVLVIIKDNQTITDLYSKKTDTFNYVPFNSSHPRHTLRNIPFSLARRIRGIVSDPNLQSARMEEMKRRLIQKKYPGRLINEAIRRACNLSRGNIINPPPKTTSDDTGEIYFVSTYNPVVKDPIVEIRNAVNVYNASQPSQKTKLKISSSYRKGPSLKDTLMFRKSTPTGVFKCREGCILCNNYLFPGEKITLKNGTTLTANERFDCLSRNILYATRCHGCGESYLGETGDQLNNRFAVHRQQGKLNSQIQAVHADQHFRICGEGKYDVFPFKRLRKNCTIYRRVVEDYHIKKLKPLLNGCNTFQARS